jgi:hypothetical protein
LAIFSSSLLASSVFLLINNQGTFGYILLAAGVIAFPGGLWLLRERRLRHQY